MPNAALLPALGLSLAVLAIGWLVIFLVGRKIQLFRQFSLPLYVAALAGAFRVYTLFDVPKREFVASAALWCLLFVPIALALRLIALYLFDIHLKTRRAIALPPLLPGVSVWAAYLLTALLTVPLVFENADYKAFFATSAVTSLVLGLALQPILTNFFAGLVVSVERSFGINDWIRVGEVEGRVAEITWRTTKLRTRDNDYLVIPNARIAEEQVLNFSQPHRLHMIRILVGVHYRTPPYRARRALVDAVQGLDGVLETPTPEVYVLSFDDSAITYELRIWIEDYSVQPRVASDARARVWESFRKAGITIPFPIRTLEIEPRRRRAQEPEGRLLVQDGPDRGREVRIAGEPVTVGRSRTCDLPLSDPQASKDHLRITRAGDRFVLSDVGSSFGTRVNGIEAREIDLHDLDRIQIGETVLVFERHDDERTV